MDRIAIRFVVETFAFSLRLLAALLDTTRILPVALPFSALAVVCPLAAAVRAQRRLGGERFVARVADYRRMPRGWQVASVAIMPAVVTAAWLASGTTDPRPTPLWTIPIFAVVYVISACCEQLGWTAWLTDRLLERHSRLAASTIVGVVWAVQDTYARALAGRFEPGTNLRAWLFRILRTCFIDRARRRDIVLEIPDDTIDAHVPSPASLEQLRYLTAADIDRAIAGGTASIEVALDSLRSDSAERDEDLRSVNFINVGKFAAMTIDIANVKLAAGTIYTADATVSLRGFTKTYPVKFDVVEQAADHIRIKGEHAFSRLDFAVGAPPVGDQPHIDTQLVIQLELTIPAKA